MKKTLVKTKIVRTDHSLTTYFWKKTWWIFGHWYPYGAACTMKHGFDDINTDHINDDAVSKLFYDNFITNNSKKSKI